MYVPQVFDLVRAERRRGSAGRALLGPALRAEAGRGRMEALLEGITRRCVADVDCAAGAGGDGDVGVGGWRVDRGMRGVGGIGLCERDDAAAGAAAFGELLREDLVVGPAIRTESGTRAGTRAKRQRVVTRACKTTLAAEGRRDADTPVSETRVSQHRESWGGWNVFGCATCWRHLICGLPPPGSTPAIQTPCTHVQSY